MELFNPFDNIFLDNKTCFLTGKNLNDTDVPLGIFPNWVLDQYAYRGKKFVLMDNITSVAYEDLKLPCSAEVKVAFEKIDQDVHRVLENGYQAVVDYDEHKLFLWMAKIVYGILYNDILHEQKRLKNADKEFKLSASLKERFSLLHLMMQSIVTPMTFTGAKPWSITIVKLKYSKNIFHFRDSTANLLFTLGMNGFGIIACLQDNGIIKEEQQDILKKIGDSTLHPIQFEELCARFLYTRFLLQYKPEYKLDIGDKKVVIEGKPIIVNKEKQLLAPWNDAMFAKVLTDYWTPWGLTKKQIIDFPNPPISYLENENTFEFITPESITLPF